MGEKKYNGFNDKNIEKDFKPKKNKSVEEIPKFLKDKKNIIKKENTQNK